LKKALYTVTNEDQLNKIGLETGFCKRKRKLIPVHFLEMLLCKTFEGNQQSLTDHIYELQSNRELSIWNTITYTFALANFFLASIRL
jgi:hypothetical protein